jgi:phospholipid/cholesterol/gamma-HCH transport system substrate-binding protein
MVAIGVVTVLSVTTAAAGFTAAQREGEGTTVVAKFDSAAPLVNGNEIKSHGVVVGEVLAMHPHGEQADVTMQLDPGALPLHRDATVTIRPVSLLGERYVDLERGSPDAPVLSPGATIPASQTGSNVDFDDVLNVFDEPTSQGLASLVTTLGDGMRGNGENADAAVRALAPALRDTRSLTKVLRGHNELLSSLVDRTTPVAQALAADNGQSMDRLVGSADKLLAATTDQQHQLDATLDELPGALQTATGALDDLSGAARQTTPALRSMRPVTDNLREISGELGRFSDSLDPALTTAQPVLQRADQLLAKAGPVASSLRAAGPGAASSTGSVKPIVQRLTGNLDNVFKFIRYWALATNGHDGLSHYLRVNAIVNPATVTGLLPGSQNRAPSPPAGDKGAAPGPQGNLGLPQLPGIPNLPGLLSPPKNGQQSGDGGATGLDKRQESDLLGFLLGGGS